MSSGLPNFNADSPKKPSSRSNTPRPTEGARWGLQIALCLWAAIEVIAGIAAINEVRELQQARLSATVPVLPHFMTVVIAVIIWRCMEPVFVLVDDTRANCETLEEIKRSLQRKS